MRSGTTRRRVALVSLFLLLLASARADETTTQPTLDVGTIRSILKLDGSLDHDVLSLEAPRNDLHVLIDGMPVPTQAGLASRFWFYQCPCGRTRMTGEFVVCDYEADDVIVALHAPVGGYADLRIDAVSPMFAGEKPALRTIRVHGEGSADALAGRVVAALDCTGDARNQKSTTMPSNRIDAAKK